MFNKEIFFNSMPALITGWLFFSIVISIDIIHKLKVKMAPYIPLYKLIIVILVYLSLASFFYIAYIDKWQYSLSLPYYLVVYLPITTLLITSAHTIIVIFSVIFSNGLKSVSKILLSYVLGFVVAIMTGVIFSVILRTFLGIRIF